MVGLLGIFESCNKKYSGNPHMLGHNNPNAATGKTAYLFAREYREPLKAKEGVLPQRKESVSEPSSRKSSVAEGDTPYLVDISKMTKRDFEKAYSQLRQGEPDNRVNF